MNITNKKGLLKLIDEDPTLSEKITLDEAVLRTPSILEDVEGGKEILNDLKIKYSNQSTIEIDKNLKEAYELYQQVTQNKDNNANNCKIKTLTNKNI